MKDKSYYNNLLHDHICVVVFTKKNGERRVMRCTLLQNVVESISHGFTTRTVTVPDHQVRCIDVDKQEWRSFDIADVISFNIEE